MNPFATVGTAARIGLAGAPSRAENPAAPAAPDPRAPRTAFIDNLKVFLTVLVVVHHAGQPYGPTGGAWPVMHAEKYRLLGPFFHVNASFFMGLFFLISAYYLRAAYDRKGAVRFLRERLVRFGVPIVLFGLGFMPLARHFVDGKPWAQSFLPLEWAHLWFLGHLLVYALVYAGYRALVQPRLHPSTAAACAGRAPFPGVPGLVAYAAGLAVVSYVVRLAYPIDVWVRWGVPVEVAHLPQYASLFAFGIVAGRHQWLSRIPARTGRTMLALALLLVALRFGASIFHWHVLFTDAPAVDLAWCLWEALLCVGMCVGLPWLFHARWGNENALSRFLARNAFAVYVTHLPVLVFIQMAAEHTPLGPLTLTVVTGACTLVLCYGLAACHAFFVRDRIGPRAASVPLRA